MILITAPLGAIAISLSAPRLLSKPAVPPDAPVQNEEDADAKYEKVIVV